MSYHDPFPSIPTIFIQVQGLKRLSIHQTNPVFSSGTSLPSRVVNSHRGYPLKLDCLDPGPISYLLNHLHTLCLSLLTWTSAHREGSSTTHWLLCGLNMWLQVTHLPRSSHMANTPNNSLNLLILLRALNVNICGIIYVHTASAGDGVKKLLYRHCYFWQPCTRFSLSHTKNATKVNWL